MTQHPELHSALEIAKETLAEPLLIYWQSEQSVIVDGWMIAPESGGWRLSKPDGSNCHGNYSDAAGAVLRLVEQLAGERFRDTFTARRGRIVAR